MADANSSSLPDYILARNQTAIAVGLSIERQSLSHGKLTTVYRGLPRQIIAAGFSKDPAALLKAVCAKTKTIHNHRCQIKVFSPVDRYVSGFLHRTDGAEVRLTITREHMPSRHWTPAAGVDAYEVFDEYELRGKTHIFIAKDFKSLVAAGCDEKMFDDGSKESDRCDRSVFNDASFAMWAWERDEDFNVIRCRLYPENIALYEEARQELFTRSYKSPEQFRKALLGNVVFSGLMLTCECLTEAGFHYAFPDDVSGEIQRHLSHIEEIIQHTPIRVSKGKPRSAAWQTLEERRRRFHARQQQNAAKYDGEFQAFMQTAVAKPNESAGTRSRK